METTTRTHRVNRVLLAITLIASLGSPTLPSVALADTATDPTALTFEGLSPEQVEIARWAAGLFVDAGLELPPISFVHHQDDTTCHGRAGAAQRHDDHTEIHICTDQTGHHAEYLLLHEMAHAWDHHQLTDDRRQAFLELRGLEAWRNGDLRWHERGVEQAAEVIAWALMGRPIRPVRITNNECSALHTGYTILTGTEPPHDYRNQC